MENRFRLIVKGKSSEELLVMVYQFDEWDEEMLRAVEDELQNRNILPDDVSIRKQKIVYEEDIELSKGKEAGSVGRVVGWIGVSGLLGIFMGYNYAFSKTRSKYTEKTYYTYNESSRKNGVYMFCASLAVVTLYFFYKVVIAR